MNAPLLLIPLAIEWVILVTTLAPVVLVGRFTRRPRLGILIWFTTFLTAGAAVLIAFAIAIWAYTDTVYALSQDQFGSVHWMIGLVLSFAPWLALAVGGISLALVNQRLEPLVQASKEVMPLLEFSKTPLMEFMGVRVSTVAVPFAYALATSGEIVISRFVVDNLTKDELNAVLWHELCHVREKHFALKRLAGFILALSPILAASRAQVSEIERLTELSADNYALGKIDSATLYRARKLFS